MDILRQIEIFFERRRCFIVKDYYPIKKIREIIFSQVCFYNFRQAKKEPVKSGDRSYLWA